MEEKRKIQDFCFDYTDDSFGFLESIEFTNGFRALKFNLIFGYRNLKFNNKDEYLPNDESLGIRAHILCSNYVFFKTEKKFLSKVAYEDRMYKDDIPLYHCISGFQVSSYEELSQEAHPLVNKKYKKEYKQLLIQVKTEDYLVICERVEIYILKNQVIKKYWHGDWIT